MAKTLNTEKLEAAKAYYNEILDKRDAYIKEDAVYIENKRKKIKLLTSNNLAELCFALQFKEIARILILEDVIDDMIDITPLRHQYMNDYDLLEKLLHSPAIIERLNIDRELIVKILKELLNEMQEIAKNTPPKAFNRQSDDMYINKCTDKLFLEMDNQEEPKIRPKDQIDFVISLYSRFKHKGYNYHGDNADIYIAHFRAIEQRRLRAIKSQ